MEIEGRLSLSIREMSHLRLGLDLTIPFPKETILEAVVKMVMVFFVQVVS